MALEDARARARQLDRRLVDVGPRWFRNAATAFGVGAWLCLGGLWVAVPEALVVCLLAAAASTSIAAFCSVLLRRPIWHILGYGLLAALGLNLIVVEIAFGWAFVWPLSFVVLLYCHLAVVWLAAMLLLLNWPSLRYAGAGAVAVLGGAAVAVLELLLSRSGVALALVLPGLVVVASVAAATGTLRRRELAGPPWWSVPLGLVVVALAVWATTAWLLSAAGASPALRVDAIQTGLVMGAVAGAGFAVLLGVYSRWTGLRLRAPSDSVAGPAAAADAGPATGPDADAARLVSDLFATAATHLRDDQTAVRLAGLMTLEKLSRDHPEHRPTVVSVLGAYLRTPSRGGPAGLSPEERKVRLAARDVLAKTLQADAPAGWRVVADPLSDGKAFRLVSDTTDGTKA